MSIRERVTQVRSVLQWIFDPDQPRGYRGRWTARGGIVKALTSTLPAHPHGAQLSHEPAHRYTKAAGEYTHHHVTTSDNLRHDMSQTIDGSTLASHVKAEQEKTLSEVKPEVRSRLIKGWAGEYGHEDYAHIQAAASERYGIHMLRGRVTGVVEEHSEKDPAKFDQKVQDAHHFLDVQQRKAHEFLDQHPELVTKIDGKEYVHLYRGVSYKEAPAYLKHVTAYEGDHTWTEAHTIAAPLQSWTIDPHTTKDFSGNAQGLSTGDKERFMLSAYVPKDRIVSNGINGIGSAREGEFVIAGGDLHVAAARVGTKPLTKKLEATKSDPVGEAMKSLPHGESKSELAHIAEQVSLGSATSEQAFTWLRATPEERHAAAQQLLGKKPETQYIHTINYTAAWTAAAGSPTEAHDFVAVLHDGGTKTPEGAKAFLGLSDHQKAGVISMHLQGSPHHMDDHVSTHTSIKAYTNKAQEHTQVFAPEKLQEPVNLTGIAEKLNSNYANPEEAHQWLSAKSDARMAAMKEFIGPDNAPYVAPEDIHQLNKTAAATAAQAADTQAHDFFAAAHDGGPKTVHTAQAWLGLSDHQKAGVMAQHMHEHDFLDHQVKAPNLAGYDVIAKEKLDGQWDPATATKDQWIAHLKEQGVNPGDLKSASLVSPHLAESAGYFPNEHAAMVELGTAATPDLGAIAEHIHINAATVDETRAWLNATHDGRMLGVKAFHGSSTQEDVGHLNKKAAERLALGSDPNLHSFIAAAHDGGTATPAMAHAWQDASPDHKLGAYALHMHSHAYYHITKPTEGSLPGYDKLAKSTLELHGEGGLKAEAALGKSSAIKGFPAIKNPTLSDAHQWFAASEEERRAVAHAHALAVGSTDYTVFNNTEARMALKVYTETPGFDNPSALAAAKAWQTLPSGPKKTAVQDMHGDKLNADAYVQGSTEEAIKAVNAAPLIDHAAMEDLHTSDHPKPENAKKWQSLTTDQKKEAISTFVKSQGFNLPASDVHDSTVTSWDNSANEAKGFPAISNTANAVHDGPLTQKEAEHWLSLSPDEKSAAMTDHMLAVHSQVVSPAPEHIKGWDSIAALYSLNATAKIVLSKENDPAYLAIEDFHSGSTKGFDKFSANEWLASSDEKKNAAIAARYSDLPRERVDTLRTGLDAMATLRRAEVPSPDGVTVALDEGWLNHWAHNPYPDALTKNLFGYDGPKEDLNKAIRDWQDAKYGLTPQDRALIDGARLRYENGGHLTMAEALAMEKIPGNGNALDHIYPNIVAVRAHTDQVDVNPHDHALATAAEAKLNATGDLSHEEWGHYFAAHRPNDDLIANAPWLQPHIAGARDLTPKEMIAAASHNLQEAKTEAQINPGTAANAHVAKREHEFQKTYQEAQRIQKEQAEQQALKRAREDLAAGYQPQDLATVKKLDPALYEEINRAFPITHPDYNQSIPLDGWMTETHLKYSRMREKLYRDAAAYHAEKANTPDAEAHFRHKMRADRYEKLANDHAVLNKVIATEDNPAKAFALHQLQDKAIADRADSEPFANAHYTQLSQFADYAHTNAVGKLSPSQRHSYFMRLANSYAGKPAHHQDFKNAMDEATHLKPVDHLDQYNRFREQPNMMPFADYHAEKHAEMLAAMSQTQRWRYWHDRTDRKLREATHAKGDRASALLQEARGAHESARLSMQDPKDLTTALATYQQSVKDYRAATQKVHEKSLQLGGKDKNKAYDEYLAAKSERTTASQRMDDLQANLQPFINDTPLGREAKITIALNTAQIDLDHEQSVLASLQAEATASADPAHLAEKIKEQQRLVANRVAKLQLRQDELARHQAQHDWKSFEDEAKTYEKALAAHKKEIAKQQKAVDAAEARVSKATDAEKRIETQVQFLRAKKQQWLNGGYTEEADKLQKEINRIAKVDYMAATNETHKAHMDLERKQAALDKADHSHEYEKAIKDAREKVFELRSATDPLGAQRERIKDLARERMDVKREEVKLQKQIERYLPHGDEMPPKGYNYIRTNRRYEDVIKKRKALDDTIASERQALAAREKVINANEKLLTSQHEALKHHNRAILAVRNILDGKQDNPMPDLLAGRRAAREASHSQDIISKTKVGVTLGGVQPLNPLEQHGNGVWSKIGATNGNGAENIAVESQRLGHPVDRYTAQGFISAWGTSGDSVSQAALEKAIAEYYGLDPQSLWIVRKYEASQPYEMEQLAEDAKNLTAATASLTKKHLAQVWGDAPLPLYRGMYFTTNHPLPAELEGLKMGDWKTIDYLPGGAASSWTPSRTQADRFTGGIGAHVGGERTHGARVAASIPPSLVFAIGGLNIGESGEKELLIVGGTKTVGATITDDWTNNAY